MSSIKRVGVIDYAPLYMESTKTIAYYIAEELNKFRVVDLKFLDREEMAAFKSRKPSLESEINQFLEEMGYKFSRTFYGNNQITYDQCFSSQEGKKINNFLTVDSTLLLNEGDIIIAHCSVRDGKKLIDNHGYQFIEARLGITKPLEEIGYYNKEKNLFFLNPTNLNKVIRDTADTCLVRVKGKYTDNTEIEEDHQGFHYSFFAKPPKKSRFRKV